MRNIIYALLLLSLTLTLVIAFVYLAIFAPVTACLTLPLILGYIIHMYRSASDKDAHRFVSGIVERDLCPKCGASLIGNVCYYDSYMCVECELGEKAKRS